MIWYTLLVLATGGERIAELVVSARNARWSFARGGVEFGRGHFPPMVALHTGLLLACLAEVWFLDRPFCRGSAGRCSRSCSPARRCAGGASPPSARAGTPA
jgi:isoprenylcysteine carboxyl methyltransferase (ICMT) family protein YpbQ